jgi:hypothetical protein
MLNGKSVDEILQEYTLLLISEGVIWCETVCWNNEDFIQ